MPSVVKQKTTFWNTPVELFQSGGRTFSIGRWNFFSRSVELFQPLGGTFSAGKSQLLFFRTPIFTDFLFPSEKGII
jgi:hypothetical protein